MTFDEAFHTLLGHEGGYSNHPADPGGETMWGVTARVARAKGYTGPMKDLPVELAKQWYKEDYWDKVLADELPPELRYPMFDAAVNSGPRQAILWLQRSIPVEKVDGILGPVTLSTVKGVEPLLLKSKILGARLDFMTRLNTWDSFGKGWARRIASLLQ